MLVFQGTLVHSTWKAPLEIRKNVLIGVEGAEIKFIAKAEEIEKLQSKFHFSSDDIVRLHDGEFLMPGFVDTHIHAPQFPNVGKGLDLTLLDWLQKYTFPTESKYKDTDYARQEYEKTVNRLVKNGTTTACYFATIHLNATLELCDIIKAKGQRAHVGKVCMCFNSPDFYIETPEESAALTKRFIEEVLSRKDPLLTPVVTPRFVLSCTLESMKELGDIAKAYGVPIQSHLNETIPEQDLVRQLFQGYESSTYVYQDAGLLTDRTIMAHGVYLTDEEIKILRSTKTAIAHCPNSNFSIKSGLCDVRRLLDNHIKVGLGTDVSGGYHPSILDAIRMCVTMSNANSFRLLNQHSAMSNGLKSPSDASNGQKYPSDASNGQKSPSDASNGHKSPSDASENSDYKTLDYKEAFRLATLGGSQALGMETVIGNFEVGKQFDALRINVLASDSPIDVSVASEGIEDTVQKFLYLGDDRNIVEVYVAGKKIHSRKP